jgi:hypothetical protein
VLIPEPGTTAPFAALLALAVLGFRARAASGCDGR